MNIAYGLNRLGVDVTPNLSWQDFRDHYLGHLEQIGIDTRYVCIDESYSTPPTASSSVTIWAINYGNPGASLSEPGLFPQKSSTMMS